MQPTVAKIQFNTSRRNAESGTKHLRNYCFENVFTLGRYKNHVLWQVIIAIVLLKGGRYRSFPGSAENIL